MAVTVKALGSLVTGLIYGINGLLMCVCVVWAQSRAAAVPDHALKFLPVSKSTAETPHAVCSGVFKKVKTDQQHKVAPFLVNLRSVDGNTTASTKSPGEIFFYPLPPLPKTFLPVWEELQDGGLWES